MPSTVVIIMWFILGVQIYRYRYKIQAKNFTSPKFQSHAKIWILNVKWHLNIALHHESFWLFGPVPIIWIPAGIGQAFSFFQSVMAQKNCKALWVFLNIMWSTYMLYTEILTGFSSLFSFRQFFLYWYMLSYTRSMLSEAARDITFYEHAWRITTFCKIKC